MACPHAVADRVPGVEPILRLRPHPRRIALVGNPNVGKSLLFGRLTNRYATVSNYPGTTVALTRGRALVDGEVCDVIDTPGVNALEGVLSDDERITRRLIEGPEAEAVVQVVDARNLRRALMLTWQLTRIGKPLVLALNMADEARLRGLTISVDDLAREVGVPVVETVATEGRGLSDLRTALRNAVAARVPVDPDKARWAHELAARVRSQGDITGGWIEEVVGRAVRHPVAGVPILLAVLYGVYLAVGVLGAQTLVDLLEERLFGQVLNPTAVALADRWVPGAFLRDLVVGEYGLVTMGLTYAIAIVLPVVSTFFLVFGVLEDSGYLPRLAIFSDRVFRAMGLNGKAILPMVLGLGCDTMATMTTRILETPKERLIAIVLLALGIPCSAQLATIMGILGGISFAALLTLGGVVLVQMFLVGFLAARVLPGARSGFVLELPPMRFPSPANVIRKTLLRVRWYLGEAVPLFLIGTLLLFGLDRVGGLSVLARAGEPIVTGLLGLPREMSQIFVMGFLRRDYGAAGLFDLAREGTLDGVQAVIALTVMTLFVPCIANLLMIVRERGNRVAFAILAFVTPVAILTGAVVRYGLGLFGVAF